MPGTQEFESFMSILLVEILIFLLKVISWVTNMCVGVGLDVDSRQLPHYFSLAFTLGIPWEEGAFFNKVSTGHRHSLENFTETYSTYRASILLVP